MYIHCDEETKQLKLDPLRRVIKQGENFADTVVFLLPISREGMNLAGLSWGITAATDKNTFVGVMGLSCRAHDNWVEVSWPVTAEFTAVDTNAMELTLTGSAAGQNGPTKIVKFEGDGPICVEKAKTGQYSPPPYLLDKAIAEMNDALSQLKVMTENVEQIAAGFDEKVAATYRQLDWTLSENAKNYAESQRAVESLVVQAQRTINSMMENGFFMEDPTTGQIGNWKEILINIFNYFAATGAILPEEYDALNLDPVAFDNKNIDPLAFDTKGRGILMGV